MSSKKANDARPVEFWESWLENRNSFVSNLYYFCEGAVEVEMNVGRLREDTFDLSLIICSDRGKGYASSALRTICDRADQYGMTILLTVSLVSGVNFDDALTEDDLRAWYRRYGFIRNGSKYWMIRRPKKVDKISR